jgi:pimeloyl-ACP methyl ester carboxylesterase
MPSLVKTLPRCHSTVRGLMNSWAPISELVWPSLASLAIWASWPVSSEVAPTVRLGSRPQSLTAFADSPVGLAAFLLDHDRDSLALISRSFAGEKEGLTRDDVLDNITLFWLTNTAVSAARLYAENTRPFFGALGVTLPVAVSVFPDELYQAPKSWTEKAYPNLIHYNRLPRGGHFAAWEQPELLVEEVRTGLRSLR